MAYPPDVPPATRTDSTVSAVTHASDHNKIAAALAAIIAELGANPSGGYADLANRLLGEQIGVDQSALTQFLAAVTRAEDAYAAAEALVVSDLGTTDGQSRALVESRITQLRGALDAIYGQRVRHPAAARDRYPRLKLADPTPVTTPAASGLPSLGGLCVIRVAELIDTPAGNYYAFGSSDHGGAGGIHRWHFDEHGDPWIHDGLIWTAPEGTQNEFPWVTWNPATGLFHMFSQLQGTVAGKVSSQVEVVATSPTLDVGSFTYRGRSHDYKNVFGAATTGGLHTGYQRITLLNDGLWFSLGLTRGSDGGRYSRWYSRDGLKFHWDGREVHAYEGAGLNGDLLEWDGQTVGYGQVKPPSSGGAVALGKYVMGRVADDFRNFSGTPTVIYDPDADAFIDSRDIVLIPEGGRLHAYASLGKASASVNVYYLDEV